MSRSLKKGPHVDPRLMTKVERTGKVKEPIKTWSRDCTIVPDFIGFTFLVHNGKVFTKVFVTEDMIEYHWLSDPTPRVFQLGVPGSLASQYVVVKFGGVVVKGANYAHYQVLVDR